MRKILLLLTFIILSFSIFSEEISLNEFVDMGDRYLEDKSYEEAIFVYNEALSKSENNLIILHKIAVAYKLKNKLETSLAFLDKILALDENFNLAYLTIAEIYKEKADAIDDDKKKNEFLMLSYENYLTYLSVDEFKDSELIFNLGNNFFKKNLYEKSYNIFSKENKNDLRNYFGAAITARFLGYYNESIKSYNKVISLNDEFAEAYLGLAISYKLSGKIFPAIENYEKYLKIKEEKLEMDDLQNEKVFIDIAILYISKNKYAEAKKTAENGIKYFKSSQELRDLIFEIYTKLGN